jgi:diaminopimelate decarboxylase
MLTRDPDGQARLGGVRLADVIDQPGQVETPAYVYDLDGMAAAARGLVEGFGGAPHLVAYAVKANSAGPIIRAIAAAGCGAEVVSGGELALVLKAGVAPDRVLYSGVAKKAGEIDLAIGAGDRGIAALQLESVAELARVEGRAKALGRVARVGLRINPGVEADTHEKVATGHDEAKFGVALEDLDQAFESLHASKHLAFVAVGCHVGSQLTETSTYLEAARRVLAVARRWEQDHPPLELVDFGGGFGVDYGAGCKAAPGDFARAAIALLQQEGFAGRRVTVEPGRSLVAEHGVLVARVVSSKASKSGRRWLLIDAGMNDLIRPALYGAHHRIEPLDAAPTQLGDGYRVVGPVCESSDDFGVHRFASPLPELVVIRDAGAYGFTMASEYNGRPLPAEVFLAAGRVASIKPARSVDAWVEARL